MWHTTAHDQRRVTLVDTSARPLDHPNISSEDVEGVAVYDVQGKKIGKVDHLVIEKASGRVATVVLNVNGFLGLGHSHVELPWSALKYSSRLNGFETQETPRAR
jgi:sporulation protein YlmC with PRC-barrel domain